MNRYMNNTAFWIIGLMSLILFSCTDVVQVEVPDGGDRLVVEASILWEKGTTGQTQIIRLSSSTPYFSEGENVPVRGAQVRIIKDANGQVFEFLDQEDGSYLVDDFVPEIDQSYTLEIDWQGKSYSAQSVLISVPEITRVTQTAEGGFTEDETVVNVHFNDPINAENYYLADFLASDDVLNYLQALDDEFSDGREMFAEYEREGVEAGVEVNFSLQGLSEGYYNYLEILIEQAGGDEGPFATTPVQLKGNCRNVNDDTEEVLGYFRLSEVVYGSYIIE